MNHAVAMVQAYLRVNGYFTVAEYPVVETTASGRHRTATDIDMLAHRFPHSGRLVPDASGEGEDVAILRPDPALSIGSGDEDVLIGEVKEGEAHLNRSATDPHVLRAALTRFGGCDCGDAAELIEELVQTGTTQGPRGRIRLIAFGSSLPDHPGERRHEVVLLAHILDFLESYIREHWEVVSAAHFDDPAFGFLMMMEKARRNGKR